LFVRAEPLSAGDVLVLATDGATRALHDEQPLLGPVGPRADLVADALLARAASGADDALVFVGVVSA
jgi:hypothetical protein